MKTGGKLYSTIVISSAILIILLLILGFWFAATRTITETDTEKYLQIKGAGSLNFIVFPKRIEDVPVVNEYHYIDHQLKDGMEILLDASYDEESFREEINRLESITYSFGGYPSKSVKKDNAELFNYVTYITVFNSLGEYEYACIDEENYRIIYVGLRGMSYQRISFDKKYLPKDYEYLEDIENLEIDDSELGYVYEIYSMKEFYGKSNGEEETEKSDLS